MNGSTTAHNMIKRGNRKALHVLAASLTVLPGTAFAVPITSINTTVADDYVIVGMAAGSFGTTVNINSFELGQITGPLPGSAPAVPGNAQSVVTGIDGGGNVAVTNDSGTFNFQNMEIAATLGIGIECAASSCDNGSSNSAISFDLGASYDSVPANGVATDVDHSALLGEIAIIRDDIDNLDSGDYDDTIDLSSDGKITGDRFDSYGSGLNVVYIATGGDDFLLENGNWVIDGLFDTTVLFVFDEAGKNFKVSNANILAGTGGIGLDNILFVALDSSGNSGTKFDFSNSILNGVSFWDLSSQNNIIGLNNVGGCTQLVGDRVENINDVRLTNCSFGGGSTSVPEPGTLALLGIGLAGMGLARRKKKT